MISVTCVKCGKSEEVPGDFGMHRIVCLACCQTEVQVIVDLTPDIIENINQKFREIDRNNRNDLRNHTWSDQKPITLGVTRTELKKLGKK